MKVFCSILMVLFVVGCADSHAVRVVRAPTTKLSPNASIYISIPKDGSYGSAMYHGSGISTATAVQAAFLMHAKTVTMANSVEELPMALENAKAKGLDYTCRPVILHWEDRATEWSGIPDKITIKVSLYDTANGDEVASSIIDGSSGLATIGGNHPQDLLPEPTRKFVDQLY